MTPTVFHRLSPNFCILSMFVGKYPTHSHVQKKTNYVQCISHVFIPIGSSYSWKKRWNLHSGRSSCRITTKVTRNCNVRFFLKKNMFLTTKVGTDSSQLCVGFLFLILYPGSLPPPASLLPPPSACHTPSLTYNNFTHTNLTYNFVTYHTSHTQT